MINEIIFFSQIIILTVFISIILYKKEYMFLYILFSIILILLNILVNQEITIFNLNACAIESYSAALFWISSLIFIIDGETGAQRLIKISILTNIFSSIMFITVFLYIPNFGSIWIEIYDKLLSKYILSVFISTITFIFAYYIERKIYSKIVKYFHNKLISQAISVCIGQFFDTIIFGFLYFNKPGMIILEIIIFSCIVKFICIAIFFILFNWLKNYFSF